MSDEPKSGRLRFSLKGLLILTAVVSLGLGGCVVLSRAIYYAMAHSLQEAMRDFESDGDG